jgi:stage III sporulation protein SpoIIIAA
MKSDLDLLLKHLPRRLRVAIEGIAEDTVEIALDLGRPPIVRLRPRVQPPYRELDGTPVSRDELEFVIGQVGTFRRHNRAGIEQTLHRLSLIRDRYGDPLGITIRVGRHLAGVAEALRDMLEDDRESLVLIGPPGSGKTTLLRDAARILAERLGPAVMIVDSHNEIGGDGKLPHPAIGAARRMPVPDTVTQHEILLEAVRNHFPAVVIIDELGSRPEAEAARTIASRGVRLIATAHGHHLEDIVGNPELIGLVGGGCEKPVIGTAVVLLPQRRFALYRKVARAASALQAGGRVEPDEIRGDAFSLSVVHASISTDLLG